MTNFKDRDCENCIHRVPKLNSDGTWTAECESWNCNYQNRKEILETFNARMEKESSWIWQTYTNGFGTFKALRCERCGAKRNQAVLNYCAICGAKMNNADELGGVL